MLKFTNGGRTMDKVIQNIPAFITGGCFGMAIMCVLIIGGRYDKK